MSKSALFRNAATWTPATITTLLALMLVVAPAAASASPLTSLGHAYGSTATLGATVEHGRSALATLTCDGDFAQRSALAIDAGPHYTIASVTNTLQGEGEKDDRSTTASSILEDISVLDGLITAQSVAAVSTTSGQAGAFETSGDESSFESLTIGGYYIGADVEPNTQIALPGVGHVVLNEQSASIGVKAALLRVNMIHVYVTDVGAPVSPGTEIIVGSAVSMLSTRPGDLTGSAHGTAVWLPGGIYSAPTAPIGLGCSGTDGQYMSNVLAGVDVSPLVETGDMVNVVMGDVETDWSVAEVSSTVNGVELLEGLITADSLSAQVSLLDVNGAVELEASAWFSNLRIAGLLMGSRMEPNTSFPLPGIGIVWLNFQGTYNGQKRVRAILIDVTESNSFGLPIGSRIRVANAKLGIAP